MLPNKAHLLTTCGSSATLHALEYTLAAHSLSSCLVFLLCPRCGSKHWAYSGDLDRLSPSLMQFTWLSENISIQEAGSA